MADQNKPFGQPLNPSSGKRDAGSGLRQQSAPVEDTFAGDFEKLKSAVIRPAFETIGNGMKERGHEFNISEEPGGKISIHIVPAGVNKSIHPYDWFPTFSIFGVPFTKSAGLHGRNMRRNSEVASGTRGDYKLALVNQQLVERELTKFIGEIANWQPTGN